MPDVLEAPAAPPPLVTGPLLPPKPFPINSNLGLEIPPAPNAFPAPVPPEIVARLPENARVLAVDYEVDNNTATTIAKVMINWDLPYPVINVVDGHGFAEYLEPTRAAGITIMNYMVDKTKPYLSVLYGVADKARYTLWLDKKYDSTGDAKINWRVRRETLDIGNNSENNYADYITAPTYAEWTSGNAYRVSYANSSITGGAGGYWVSSPPPTKAEMFLQRIRQNLAPTIIRHRDIDGVKLTAAEVRARELLKEMIGEVAFRRYLLRGFILARGGKSGTLYKIHGGHGRIESFVKDPKGKNVPFESFCVQFKDCGLPHTDGVIMRKLLVEFDEATLRKTANIAKLSGARFVQPDFANTRIA